MGMIIPNLGMINPYLFNLDNSLILDEQNEILPNARHHGKKGTKMDKKALNLPILISLVMGSMIGTGIYILPASLAEYGSLSLISWVYTSIGAIFLALTFAHLNKRFPKTGGPYVYCREAYGKPTGFIIAYTYWMSNMVSIEALQFVH